MSVKTKTEAGAAPGGIRPGAGRRPDEPGQPKIGEIHLRVPMARKSAYVRAAKPLGLSEWMTKVCDRACGYGETEEAQSR